MKNKGFTLIELLAVIVILAIIALIATPMILGVIEKARKGSAEQSALGYIDAVEKQILIGEVNENKIPYETKSMYTVAELTDTYQVMVKGEKPKKGNICIDKKGNVEQYSIVVNDYVISNTTTQKKIIKGSEPIEIKCGIYISSVDDLIQLENEVNAGDNKSGQVYYLMNDLDLGGKFDENGNQISGGTVWTPIGTSSTPFSGVFDGNGHVISNMYVHTEGSAALFGYIKDSEVKNLGIVNSYIISTNSGAASIVGNAYSSTISNCYNTSIISGKKSTSGIVVFMGSSTIENCYNAGIVNSNEEQFAAGIAGYISSDSTIKNCYNSGTILGNYNASGIVGGSQGITENCFNIGNMNGSTRSGGIVGQAYLSPKISNSYNTGSGAIGGIVGDLNQPENPIIKNNYYLEGVSKYGIHSTSSNSGAKPLSKEKMPDVLSVINHDGAFKEDTNHINNGNPILNWQ